MIHKTSYKTRSWCDITIIDQLHGSARQPPVVNSCSTTTSTECCSTSRPWLVATRPRQSGIAGAALAAAIL